MEQRRKESVNSENNQKRKQLSQEFLVVTRKKFEMEDLVKELDADVDKFVLEAGITDDIVKMKKLVTKANSVKELVKEKNKQIHEL